jgi:hypothetical protein
MQLATLHLETAKYGDAYRAARLAMLRHQMVQHIERTDASAQEVEQALARLAEANTLGTAGRRAPHAALPPGRCPR